MDIHLIAKYIVNLYDKSYYVFYALSNAKKTIYVIVCKNIVFSRSKYYTICKCTQDSKYANKYALMEWKRRKRNRVNRNAHFGPQCKYAYGNLKLDFRNKNSVRQLCVYIYMKTALGVRNLCVHVCVVCVCDNICFGGAQFVWYTKRGETSRERILVRHLCSCFDTSL